MNEHQNVQKIDEGFELVYWKLSYRRKFLRTLWMIPFIILAVFSTWLVWHSTAISITAALVLIIVEIVQAVYTYNKWKCECRNRLER